MTDSQSTARNRLLFVSHYYPPERNAPAHRVSELAKLWSHTGRHVEIITGMPNHPTGVIPETHRGRWYCREECDGVIVHRGRIYPAANQGVARRILNYLSFMISAIITGVCKVGPTDCVIATSPHLFTVVSGWVLSVLKGAPFIFEVRDIWPAEIVAVGAIRNRFVIRILEALEMFLYRRADRIVAVADGTVELLTKRSVPREKLVVVANGVDTDTFIPGSKNNTVRESLNLNGEFVAAYIGTIGMAHRLEIILDAAALLKNRRDIRFLIVGNGAERARLEEQSEKMHLTNIVWSDEQPRNRIADYYRSADACIVHLRNEPLFTKNIPSKMYEIMACGRPMLLGTIGESRRLGERAGCVSTFAPDDSRALADAVVELADDAQQAQRLGRAGRRFAVAHCAREARAREYLSVIDSLTES